MKCCFTVTRLLTRPARIVVLLLVLLLTNQGRAWAQSPVFNQTTSFGGSSNITTSRDVASDAAGNQYVTGTYAGTLVLGATTLVTAGFYNEMFVAKRSAVTGAWLWAVRVGGSANVIGSGLAVDAGGNVLVTGNFEGTASFPSPAATTLSTGGGSNVYLAKFAASTGACTWAVRVGGSGLYTANRVAVDAGGNALVTGRFEGTASFPTSPAATALNSAGGFDVFVAKFTASTGACTWAVRAGGSANDIGYGVAVDAGGNALVTGVFSTTASFPTGPAAATLTSAGLFDVFVAKFTASTGACTWAVRAGGSANDTGFGVAADAGGNALVTGGFDGTISFPTSPAAIALTSAGGTDMFVAKFAASNGTGAWAVRAGGTGADVGYGVATDAGGNALVTGGFYNTASFGTNIAAPTLTSAGLFDVFVAKFGANTGTGTWAVRAGGTGNDVGNDVALDAGGNALVTGTFERTADFGTVTLTASSSGRSCFVTVLSGLGTLATPDPTDPLGFTLSPNPARTACYMQGLQPKELVSVLDALGRPILNATADATGSARLLLPDGLTPGLYLVRSRARVQRLLVE
jgi:hypothetical protein